MNVMSTNPAPRAERLLVIGSFIHASCWQLGQLPQTDESRLAHGFAQENAGKGLAVAIGAHRLGTPVDLLLAIGQDAAGDALLAQLAGEGLDASLVQRHPGHSGHGAGMSDPAGNTLISIHPGANDRLDVSVLARQPALLQTAGLVYAQLEAPLAAVSEALDRARGHGAATLLNPSPWQPLPATLLASADMLIVNRREAAALLDLGQPLPDGAEPAALLALLTQAVPGLRRRWPGSWLIVTLGPDGCAAFGPDGQTLHRPARPVDAPHAIGAGDAFSAGLCHALLRGLPMPRALELANACGALAVSRPGIVAALPRRDEVHALLNPAA